MVATAVAAATLAGVAPLAPFGLGSAPVAEASNGPTPRSTSPQIAETASHALAALERFDATGSPELYVGYLEARDRAAVTAAEELGLDPTAMADQWRRAEPTKQVALLAALSQLGVPYRRNSSVEGVGFDCSGLTRYAYGRAGVELAPNSRQQINAAADVAAEQSDAGDLVFYPGHVMMSLGVDGAVVHSRNTGSHVEITFATTRRTLRFGDPLR